MPVIKKEPRIWRNLLYTMGKKVTSKTDQSLKTLGRKDAARDIIFGFLDSLYASENSEEIKECQKVMYLVSTWNDLFRVPLKIMSSDSALEWMEFIYVAANSSTTMREEEFSNGIPFDANTAFKHYCEHYDMRKDRVLDEADGTDSHGSSPSNSDDSDEEAAAAAD